MVIWELANGYGIDFSASGNFGTMNSEILDDYEEGYWTPTIGGHVSDGSSTYGHQKGSYVRIGGILHLNWYINWTSTSASGQFRIYGLPYAAATTYGTNYNITPGSMMFNNINVDFKNFNLKETRPLYSTLSISFSVPEQNHDPDIPDEVKAICTAAWTPTIKVAWKTKLISEKSGTPT